MSFKERHQNRPKEITVKISDFESGVIVITHWHENNVIRKERKNLVATPTGIELIGLIREDLLKSAELTGLWEKKLREIEKKTYQASQFLDELKQMVLQIVNAVLSDNSNRRITVVNPNEEKKKKRGTKVNPQQKSNAQHSTSKKSSPANNGQRLPANNQTSVPDDSILGSTCPVCGKGHIIKGNTAYGCSEWKSGCTFRLPFQVKQ